ncbi:Glucose N-acetyltransferase 1, partial [Neolecta irregularis DAH-3]
MNKRFNHILCGVALLLLAGCWSLFFQFRYKSPDQPFSDEPIIPELAVPNVIVPPIAEAPPKIHLASMPGQKPDRNLAYAFYATEHGYACSVLVNMHILKNRLKTKVPFVWLVTEKVPEIYATIARDKFGADVRTVTTLDPPPGAWDKYKEVMTKFQIFKLFEFDRLIVLDSDILVQKNLDHLFYLPSVDLALPRANWLSDTFLTSAMFVAEPSEKLWNRIEKRLSNLGNAEFDMDLINSEFLGEALVLPG